MTEKKMTVKEFYGKVISGDISAEVIEFAKVALEKANARTSKVSGERAKENAIVMEKVKTVLTDEPQGAGEIAKALDNEYSTQKISYVLGAMASNGDCNMVQIKINGRKVNGYSVITEVTDDVEE